MTFEGFAALLIIGSGAASTLFYRLVWRPFSLMQEANQKASSDAIATLEKRVAGLQGENERAAAEYHNSLERLNKETQEIIDRHKFNLDRADADAQKLRLELSDARAAIEVETQARIVSVRKQTDISTQLFNAQEKIKHLEDWSTQQDINLEKQAEQHEADLTRINNKTAEQIAKMRVETSGIRDLYTQVQEDQQRQGKEIMELTTKLENARGILRRWGLSAEEVEGLLSGLIDPKLVEPIVGREIAKHLLPPEPAPPAVEEPKVVVSQAIPEKPKDPITPLLIEIPKAALPPAPTVPPDGADEDKGETK